jgi:hypothetical protein
MRDHLIYRPLAHLKLPRDRPRRDSFTVQLPNHRNISLYQFGEVMPAAYNVLRSAWDAGYGAHF